MPGCAMKTCKSRYDGTANRDFALFSFPAITEIEREKWITFVQRDRGEPNWLPSACSKLCSKHFRSEDLYSGKKVKILLKKGSVPHREDETNVDANRVSPVSVDVSDTDSIFDSPRKIALKARIRKLQKINILHRAKMRKINQQNRYLEIKVKKLTDLTKHLKKKLTSKVCQVCLM